MKKFILGVICGALIFGGTSVLADSLSLVGKTVQKEVTVNFNGEPLAVKAIMVNNTTYLPIRMLGNLLGAKIEYKDGEVHMEKPDEYQNIKEQILTEIMLEEQKGEIKKKIAELQLAIENGQKRIVELEDEINRDGNDGVVKEALMKAKEITQTVLQQQLAQLAELEAQLAELEATEE